MKRIIAAALLAASIGTAAAQQAVDALDFAVDMPAYLEKRITITGVFFAVEVNYGHLMLPGINITVQFAGLPREDLKQLIRDCSGLSTKKVCERRVTATVTRGYGPKPELTDPRFEQPTKTDGSTRS